MKIDASDAGPSRPPKRRKTARACNYCRDHKLKCDFNSSHAGENPICKHCRDFGIECKVIARVKVRRGHAKPSNVVDTVKSLPLQSKSPILTRKHVALTEPRYAGPTSLSQLVSAVTRKWPSRANQMLSSMDSQYGHARIEGVSGGPFLMLPQERYAPQQRISDQLEKARLSISNKRILLAKYQRYVNPAFAILSDRESEAAVELGVEDQPLATLSNLGLALLALAAMTRDTPLEIRQAILYHIRGRPPVELGSSLETIQYILLLCANVETLSTDTNISTGMSLNLTGIMTRMAQDLGLHREIAQLNIPKAHLRKRARIWAACIVQDRWFSVSYGQPCLIRLEDCDAPPPSPFHDDVLDAADARGDEKPYEMHVEHAKLGTLMSRLLHLVFTPRGLQNTPIAEMEKLKNDLDQWSKNLPASLRVSGRPLNDVSIGAGFLHLLKVSVDFIFYRAALVSTYNTSKSASMSPPSVWEDIVTRSAEAIEWISTKDGTSILDAWSVAMYCLIQCCLVQFYAAVGGGDPTALRIARHCLHSWSSCSEAQSHGYYDPKEGDEPLPSSTTTTALPNSPEAKGKKSLTLRTKAYTVVAMLAGIAEHHIANRPEKAMQAPATGAKTTTTTTKKNKAAGGKASLPHARAKVSPRSTGPASSNTSAFRFDAVLNHDGPPPPPSSSSSSSTTSSSHVNSAALPVQQGGGVGSGMQDMSPNGMLPSHPPLEAAAAYHPGHAHGGHSGHTAGGGAYSTSSFTQNAAAAADAAAAASFAAMNDSFNGGVEQIDLVTLQRWADEVMRNPPSFDTRFLPSNHLSAAQPSSSSAAAPTLPSPSHSHSHHHHQQPYQLHPSSSHSHRQPQY